MHRQLSAQQAMESAGRLMQEGRAQSVKLEGGQRSAPAIARLVEVGIPVVGHVGLTPQSHHAMGGFRVQGRDSDGAEQVIADALAVEEAGAFCIVLECVPTDVAAEITSKLSIPTIGIGAGSECDGQVLVSMDLLGFDLSFKPRFVKRYAEFQNIAVNALDQYADEVRSGEFPGPEHSFARKSPRKVMKLY